MFSWASRSPPYEIFFSSLLFGNKQCIPNDIYVKEKDDLGKLIECNLCHIKIRIISQFCFTEWVTHCEGVKHCKIANSETVKMIAK